MNSQIAQFDNTKVSNSIKMPQKAKVIVAWMSFLLILSTVKLIYSANLTTLLTMIFHLVLLVGLLKGSEGARSILLGLGYIGISMGSLALFSISFLLLSGNTSISPVFIGLFLGSLINFSQYVYFVWCLNQDDVQHWILWRGLEG